MDASQKKPATYPSAASPRGLAIGRLVDAGPTHFWGFTVAAADWPAIRDRLSKTSYQWLGLRGPHLKKDGDVWRETGEWILCFVSHKTFSVAGASLVEKLHALYSVTGHCLVYGAESAELSPRWEKEVISELLKKGS